MQEIDRNLFKAARKGQADELVKLLGLGANAKAADVRRATPLMVAAMSGHSVCIQVLLPFSDPLVVDEEGCTALIYACQHRRLDCAMALIGVSDVDRKDYEGLSALDHASLGSDTELLGFIQSFMKARWDADELETATPHGSDGSHSVSRL